MMSPGAMNIRRTGLVRGQRMHWGIPTIHEGDWLAERTGNIVYFKRPWEGSPLIRVPALSDTDLVGSVVDAASSYVSGAQQSIADQAAAGAVEAIRPYLAYAILGGVSLMVLAGFAGYALGRSER